VFRAGDSTGTAGRDNFPVTVTYTNRGFSQGDLNPRVYFDSVEMIVDPTNPTGDRIAGGRFNDPGSVGPPPRPADNQNFFYEFSTQVTIPVNTLARNAFTAQLYADLSRLIHFVETIRPTTREDLETLYTSPPFSMDLYDDNLRDIIYQHMDDENSFISNAINTRLDNMLFNIDRHAADFRRELTDIGSRGRRLELFQARLENDEGSLYQLMSANEDIDIVRLTTLMATAEARYMAALMVGTNIMNVTLGHFLQV
jgi:flagellar hook-associated protein 3 FlgL